MILTTIIASALVFGTVREVTSAYSKTQELETLKKQLKMREGQVDLLLTAKSINQQSRQNNGLNKKACDCKALQTKESVLTKE